MPEPKEKQRLPVLTSRIQISRGIYDERLFDHHYGDHKPIEREGEEKRCSPLSALRRRKCGTAPRCSATTLLSWIRSFFPILKWLPRYSLKENLLSDLTGGLTVGIMHIPQGLAFAMLTTLPAVTGLYTALVPVLLYMVMGTSRHLSVGSFAVICLMVAQVIEREMQKMSFDEIPSAAPTGSSLGNSTWPPTTAQPGSSPWSARDAMKMEIAVSLSFLIGIMQVAMGLARLGFVALFLSDPLISGFTTGSAVLVVITQLKHIFGLVKIPQFQGYFSSVKLLVHMLKNVPSYNGGSIITGVLCIGLLLGMKHINERFKSKLKFPIPAELVVVVIGTSLSYAGQIDEKFGVPILGEIPKGLPPISIPRMDMLVNIIPDAFVIAVVIFATNVSLSKMFAKKHGYSIDANQELIAYGMGNIGGAFSSCFAICNALARTVLQENLAKTQMCSLTVIAVILLTLLFIAPLFFFLPKAILAAIVIANLVGLLKQFSRLRELWKICKPDSVVWFITCFSVILLGVDKGLIVGLACAIMAVIVQLSRSRFSVLGQISDTEIYRDTQELSAALEVPGVKVMRFESSLYFANVERFRNALVAVTRVDPTKKIAQPKRVEITHQYNKENSWEQLPLESTVLVKCPPTPSSSGASSDVFSSGYIKKSYSKLAVEDDDEICDEVRAVVIDGSSFTFIDSMGLMTLSSAIKDFEKVGIQIYLCACSYSIRKALFEGGFMERVGNNRLFVSVHDAVSHAIVQNNQQGPAEDSLLPPLTPSKAEREVESRL